MILSMRWDLNLTYKMVYCWEHLLDLHLDIPLTCLLDWNFKINLEHGKDLWLEFHLAECLA